VVHVSQPTWPERDWVKAGELAAFAGVNVRTILRELGRGNLAAEKHGGWVIQRPEAERWLAQFRKYAALRKDDPPGP
jgi:hypothetical protein